MSINEILDAFQRLNRNIKRRYSFINPGSHGRAQGKTLRLIEKNEGIRANELATLLDIRPSSLTQKLDKLESDGNIRRTRDKHDARVVRIYITDKGKGALTLREKEKEKITEDFSDCLSKDEKAIFIELCNRLSDNLENIYEEQKALHASVLMLKKEKTETNSESEEADKIS
jgi:DNA-binding MarR family transcriptional regulator